MALRKKAVIKFDRPYEPCSTQGYVLDIGPTFFLLAAFCDGFRFDGFLCLRISDIRGLKVPAPYGEVAKSVLKIRKEKTPAKPKIDISSIQSILISAGKKFPLLVVHRERIDPEICSVGRVIEVEKQTLTLHEIGPDALWDEELTIYRLADITQVGFGGDYETGLYQVAGAKFPRHPSSGSEAPRTPEKSTRLPR
jgi:hypothetical protein